MHLRRPSIVGRLICVVLVAIAGCAPIRGYPDDPENTDQTLASLQPYFTGAKEAEYLNTDPSNAVLRKQKRDAIILARVRAYDIEFADFEHRLYGDGNGVTVGSDLVGLVLAGLTATTGNAATKSALGAASAGVIGAKAAIDKDLYYQKTIPALLAQMEADRLRMLQPIIAGMKQSDAEYPLMQAYIDLDAYKLAGSIPAAINAVNKDAGIAKQEAQDAITLTRQSATDLQTGIVSVRGQLKALTTDAQFVSLAKTMQPFLASRSPQLQQMVKTLDPNGLRLTSGKKARQVVNAWINEDDVSLINQQQWLIAIAAIAAAR